MVEEEGALSQAARRALEICHFDPVSGNDNGGDVDGSGERCAHACYDCLLSYGNQGNHLLIDRHLAKDLLMACAAAATTRAAAHDPADAWQAVQEQFFGHRSRYEFVSWLREMEHRLPDEVNVHLSEFNATVDLVYRPETGAVAVFVDGADDANASGRDEAAEEDLREAGWFVIRVPFGATYPEIVKKYPSVFGTGRRGIR